MTFCWIRVLIWCYSYMFDFCLWNCDVYMWIFNASCSYVSMAVLTEFYTICRSFSVIILCFGSWYMRCMIFVKACFCFLFFLFFLFRSAKIILHIKYWFMKYVMREFQWSSKHVNHSYFQRLYNVHCSFKWLYNIWNYVKGTLKTKSIISLVLFWKCLWVWDFRFVHEVA